MGPKARSRLVTGAIVGFGLAAFATAAWISTALVPQMSPRGALAVGLVLGFALSLAFLLSVEHFAYVRRVRRLGSRIPDHVPESWTVK